MTSLRKGSAEVAVFLPLRKEHAERSTILTSRHWRLSIAGHSGWFARRVRSRDGTDKTSLKADREVWGEGDSRFHFDSFLR